ncbi:phosphatidylserine decarboxylase-like protein [Armillaria fumosa]|nr:phosphatidylserine decarboxylase-like protein [Armillaria fumosa]
MPVVVEHRLDGWLPQDHRCSVKTQVFHPVIQEFKNLIEQDAEIYMGFHQMLELEQVPTKPPYSNDPAGKPQVPDYMTMLTLFNKVLTETPGFEESEYEVGLVGFPINAILDWPMGTPAGFTTFINPKVNAQFKKMFGVWAFFLTSTESRYVLITDASCWFGLSRSATMPDFVEKDVCDPSAEYYGFKSWDDFFTRLFRPGVCPVMFPDNDDIVNSACESTVYCIASNIHALDTFWLKGESYSLNHMLDNDPLAAQFVGGTVYQAFLSAMMYHHWYSPTIMIPGTYYAESPAMGFPIPDPSAPTLSQGFITAIATRALIFIQADNPNIGLMCFVAVGMAEVPTCEITINEGDRITKGMEMEMFHFGGSTHCLIFRPETKITFSPDYPVNSNVQLNAAIATVK